MTDVLINKELTLSVPEGYRLMDAVELERYFGLSYNRWGILDKKRRIIVSVSWTDKDNYGLFADLKRVVDKAEETFAKNLIAYRRTGDVETTVASIKAKGVRFTYKTDKTESETDGEVVILKRQRLFYAIYYISAKDRFDENLPEFETMLGSVRFSEPEKNKKSAK